MKKILLGALLLGGCASGPTDFAKDYQAALAARPGVKIADRADGERLASRFASLYGDLSPSNVQSKVRDVYAPDAWFNDTIATESGIAAIEKYLLKTAQGSESVKAKLNDTAFSGSDCYVRWTMEVRTKNLAGGRPIITEGMSQLRFDEQGRIVFHQDFYNPADGIYRHLPLLGPAIRYVNGLIAR